MNREFLAALAIAALFSFTAKADLAVNLNLGTLATPSSTNLSGSTVGANQNADFYPPINLDETLGEIVYEFSVSTPSAFSITNNEGIFVGVDNDHFFLSSLSTTFDGTDNLADGVIGFVDEDGGYVGVNPGTYFLSVDTYGDAAFGGGVEGPYDINLNVSAIPSLPATIHLGTAGQEGDPISIDSFDSDFDTELGLYDSLGNLLDNNDDAGGVLQSEILIPGGLGEGRYYVALGGFNTDYGVGFGAVADVDSEGGNYVMNVNALSTSRVLDVGSVEWFSFDIRVPEPTSAVVGLMLGLACVACRRS